MVLSKKDYRLLLFAFLFIILFILFVGVNTVLSYAKEDNRTSVETTDDATLTDARLKLKQLNVATSTDAGPVYDRSAYMTFSNESAGPAVTEIQVLTGIYRMSISIRNLLIVLISMIFLAWSHKTLKASVFRFAGKGMK